MKPELERIEAVYRNYEANPRIARRWDPSAPGNRENVAARDSQLCRMLAQRGFAASSARVLEIGAGDGAGIQSLLGMGFRAENLTAVDFRASAVGKLQQRFPQVKVECADATALPFAAGSFDAVSVFTVFSSVSAEMQAQIAAEVARVLRPGGMVLWYEMRYSNPANPNVKAVTRRALARMFPGFTADLRSTTLVPQLVRHLPLRRILFPLLAAVPWLRTHWAGVLQKRNP